MARPLHGTTDLDELLERSWSARYVLIGEASHGTSDFYSWRAELTRRLIEHGFSFVAVEGDWPDCHELHRCVIGAPGVAQDPAAVLWRFRRWPSWMWANEEVADFARWLRGYNLSRDGAKPVGFHGLDVYSLWESLDSVLDYLRSNAPDRVDAALAAFRCFEPYRSDPNEYALASGLVPENCEQDVVSLLAQLRRANGGRPVPGLAPEFVAWQNAEVVAGAERYYRAMMRGGSSSWNVRDRHMTDTLDRLMYAYGSDAKGIVWAHNTHVGDARATDMAAAGMVNIGQLTRERHGEENVVAVGFSSHRGSVIASDAWGGEVRRLPVPAAKPGSVEDLLHEAVPDGDSLFVFQDDSTTSWASQVRDHRAIGVVYRPERERRGNYVPTILDRRYDALIHCDHSAALRPLHPWPLRPVEHVGTELETYPFAE